MGRDQAQFHHFGACTEQAQLEVEASSYEHFTTTTDHHRSMRLTKQNIERNGSGAVTLIPEDPEDMVPLASPWILLRVGDHGS